MGIILIIIGILIQRALYKSDIDNNSEDWAKYASEFMINPLVRLVLVIVSWGLMVFGVITLFS